MSRVVMADWQVKGALVLIMQQLHENDLAGELLHPELKLTLSP